MSSIGVRIQQIGGRRLTSSAIKFHPETTNDENLTIHLGGHSLHRSCNDGLTSFSTAEQNLRPMHRFSACAAIAALFSALLTAPLFHVHDHDEEGHSVAFVHAHLVDVEAPSEESGPVVEKNHSHANARWIDVLSVNTASTAGFQAVAEFSELLLIPAPVENPAVISWQLLRAHSPPKQSDLSPRAPPIL